nr:hypothetical protein [Tanacetum cinerariifolium]
MFETYVPCRMTKDNTANGVEDGWYCRQTIKKKRDWESFISAWNLLQDTPTWMPYLENYEQLQSVLEKYPCVLRYVTEQWLNNHKEKFVSAWADVTFNFNNRTTKRVESQHAKLKKFLKSKSCGLDLFLGCINDIVQSQVTAINESFERSECIVLESIDIFWRTLEVSWSKPLEHEDIQCEDELHISNENFNKQSKAGKRSFLRKLGCISNPSALLVKELAVKKNTRGRPSLKKQQKRKCVDPDIQDPSKSSFSTKRFWIDLNNDPPRHSSCSNYETCARDVLLDLNKEPPRHSSYVSRSSGKHGSHTVTCVPERFLKQLPQIFHPYVTELQDVIGDGNCRFRSIAVALGLPQDQRPRIRSDLASELDCNRQKYKVVISLSHGGNIGGCTTSFPLWLSPPQSEPPETIVIARVNGNHFIRATLHESCPLPLTRPL